MKSNIHKHVAFTTTVPVDGVYKDRKVSGSIIAWMDVTDIARLLLMDVEVNETSPSSKTTSGTKLTWDNLYSEPAYKIDSCIKVKGITTIHTNSTDVDVNISDLVVNYDTKYSSVEDVSLQVTVSNDWTGNIVTHTGTVEVAEAGDFELLNIKKDKVDRRLNIVFENAGEEHVEFELKGVLILSDGSEEELVINADITEVDKRPLDEELFEVALTGVTPIKIGVTTIPTNIHDLLVVKYNGEVCSDYTFCQLSGPILPELAIGENIIKVEVKYHELCKIVNINIPMGLDESKIKVVDSITVTDDDIVTIDQLYSRKYLGKEMEYDVKLADGESLEDLALGDNIIKLSLKYEYYYIDQSDKLQLKSVNTVVDTTVTVTPNADKLVLTPVNKTITDGDVLVAKDLVTVKYDNKVVVANVSLETSSTTVGVNNVTVSVTYKGITKTTSATVTVKHSATKFVVTPVNKTINDGETVNIKQLVTTKYDNKVVVANVTTEADLSALELGANNVEIIAVYQGITKTTSVTITVKHSADKFVVTPVNKTINDGDVIVVKDLVTTKYDNKVVVANVTTEADLSALELGANVISITAVYQGITKTVESTVTVEEVEVPVEPTEPEVPTEPEA